VSRLFEPATRRIQVRRLPVAANFLGDSQWTL
jgi:hypothetical protein